MGGLNGFGLKVVGRITPRNLLSPIVFLVILPCASIRVLEWWFFWCILSVNQSRDAIGAKQVGGEKSMGFSLSIIGYAHRGQGQLVGKGYCGDNLVNLVNRN